MNNHIKMEEGITLSKDTKYKEIVEKGIDLNLLKDIAILLENEDEIKMAIAVRLTKKLLDGYIISNNSTNKGLTAIVTSEIVKIYNVYKEESSNIIVNAMFEEINGRRYAVGINTLVERFRKAVK